MRGFYDFWVETEGDKYIFWIAFVPTVLMWVYVFAGSSFEGDPVRGFIQGTLWAGGLFFAIQVATRNVDYTLVFLFFAWLFKASGL